MSSRNKILGEIAVYVRWIDRLSQACGAVAIALIMASVLVVSQMVFVRYVLNASTVWQTEFVIYALVAATFLGSPYVLLHKGHVNVDILVGEGRSGVRFYMKRLADLVGILFCAMLAWSGWEHFHEAWAGNWTTDTVWALPLWIPLLPLPVGIGIMVLQYIAEIIKAWEART